MIRAGIVAVLSLLLFGAGSARALTLEEVGDFESPTYVTSDPGDASRLFVVERHGTIEVLEGETWTQFADISAEVGCGVLCGGEHGLMSIALAPDFDASGRLYVQYADDVGGAIHIEEMLATGPSHEEADASTLSPVLSPIPHGENENHNGGQLQVDAAGNLYASTGDGGGANDQFHHAQDLESLLGKILRVTPTPGGGYTVPNGNPFPSANAPYDAIWSYGLRNPFRFSFDRASGAMLIGDVGQAAAEEVDYAPAPGRGGGANYGWNCREGFLPGPADDPECASLSGGDFVDPIFTYPHTEDPDTGENRCAIIGGYVVRDPALGALFGHYLYADLCAGAVRALTLPTAFASAADCFTGLNVEEPVSFGEDAAARLYVVTKGGPVYRIAGLPPASCPRPLPPTEPTAAPKATYIGIRALRRRVKRGKRAVLTVFVGPCEGRRNRGEEVALLRNGRLNGSQVLDRACTARFARTVRRGTSFRAQIREVDGFAAAFSRPLRIRIAHRHRHRRS
ncbi:MAG TPA: PQQ-dependent sugar dehydrogenase [Solirubrobacterales bacterium]|nr:PQQ-dependent sugar dehydrogenase [Solirubrobacterales bacterium]